MKLRHFWAQIVSWAPRHARKTFIVLAHGLWKMAEVVRVGVRSAAIRHEPVKALERFTSVQEASALIIGDICDVDDVQWH